MFKLLLTLLLAAAAAPVQAYIGPGAGISVLGSLLGILATIVVAIGAVIFWPIRKLLKRRKSATKPSESAADPSSEHPPGL
ncbi:MAG: hypothetical protein PVJ17_14990 [Lysobacterales bacterium]|jgi:hypothetical protein